MFDFKYRGRLETFHRFNEINTPGHLDQKKVQGSQLLVY